MNTLLIHNPVLTNRVHRYVHSHKVITPFLWYVII